MDIFSQVKVNCVLSSNRETMHTTC